MWQKLLVALLMAGLTVVAAADTVYKWSDSRGQIHYTDLPPTQSDAKVLGIYHQDSAVMDDEAEGDQANSGEQTTPPVDNANEPQIDREAMAAVQADVANSRVKLCQEAKERYTRYIESQRLFRETADGKREYLTDQQLTEARVRAKQAVADYCG